ncbi:MAG: hypothetical protein EDM03_07780 [Porphyrobacter sp. IPPAS B-1204]|nr:MAG: hypothetical protein EDM03_07780 [Porphyrobacter sp. IPPAS B-1204]
MAQKRNLFGWLALVVTAVAVEFFQRGNLGDHIPLALTLAGAAGGASLGCFAAAETIRAKAKVNAFGKFSLILLCPLAGLFSGTLLMRSLVLQAAFVGLPTTPQITSLEVEEADRQRKRRSSGTNYRYVISLPDGQRSFRVLVDKALYEKVGPKEPWPKVHCVRLPVETGRWGIRRVMGPNYFDPPLGVQHYRRCGEEP